MSERYTDCTAPGIAGIADLGRHTRAEMIAVYRRYYERQAAEAERALAVPDSELRVTTFLGLWACRNRQEVSE